MQEPSLDETIDDNESIDVAVCDQPDPRVDVDLLVHYHDHERVGGSGKYWIYIMAKKERDVDGIMGKVTSYGLANDIVIKRAYISAWLKHWLIIRSSSFQYMHGLCTYLKTVVDSTCIMKHYIY